MARHNDIKKIHSQLEGEGWHVIKGCNHSRRRAKTRCIYYIKGGGCRQKTGGCQGAGGCSMYHQKICI